LSNQKGSFTRFAGFLSVMGLAVGVSALLLTLFILNGFERVISDKISEFDGHVRIRHFLNEPISAKLTTIDSALINYNDGLILSSFIQRPALLRKGNLAEGVIVEGIHNEQADFINNMLVQGNLNFDNKSVVLGKRLAEQLKLSVGQKIVLFDLATLNKSNKRIKQFTISGLFHSGMTEYDKSLVFINIVDANILFGMGNSVSGYVLRVEDTSMLDEITASLNNELSYPHMVMNWKEKNRSLFKWMSIQRWPILFIFGLIALVGVVNIISALSMIVIEKTGQIGILKSLGIKGYQLKIIFLFKGLIIGISGGAIGSVIALLIASLQNNFKLIRVPEDIYFMDFIPIDISILSIINILLFSIIFSILAALWPTLRASQIEPSEALRYE
tara:strand:+ start:6820 stop:7980 length:1161 start_codon:yes stop_codon:yes gene_type:complete